MKRTAFAGLTEVEPGESIFEDNASFTTRNLEVIDRLLNVGAVTHRHDAHPALDNPVAGPVVTFDAVGGQLPSDSPFYAGWTALDSFGGETALSPVISDVTPAAASDVPTVPAANLDTTGGALPANTYYYVVTATNASGETEGSDPVAVTVPADEPVARVLFTNLMTVAAAAGGTGWRLYRSTNGGQLGLLGQGATEVFTDDGAPCVDSQLTPPVFNTTGGTVLAHVSVDPGSLPSGTIRYRIYVSPVPTFDSPALVGEFIAADAGTVHDVPNFGLQSGSPPAQSTSFPGPGQVDARSEVSHLAEAVTALGISGGGGGSALDIVPAGVQMARPEDSLTGPALAGHSVRWLDLNGDAALGLWTSFNGTDTYMVEVYAGGNEYVPADFTGDTAEFGTNANGQFAVIGAVDTDWRVYDTAAPAPAVGFGYVELDYQTYNDNWSKIGAEIRVSGAPDAGVRLEVDRVAGTLSLIDLTGAAVLATVGAADGYTPAPAGIAGYLILTLYKGRIVAYDAQDDGTGNYLAGEGFFNVALPSAHALTGDSPSWNGGVLMNVAALDSIESIYFSAATNPFWRELYLGTFHFSGADLGLAQSTLLWSESGNGLLIATESALLGTSPSGNPLNGWTAVAGATLGGRKLAGGTHAEIVGVLDGSAATDPTIWTGLHFPIQPEDNSLHRVILEAADGTLSDAYLLIDATGGVNSLKLAQPAVPLPAGSKLHVDLTYRSFG